MKCTKILASLRWRRFFAAALENGLNVGRKTSDSKPELTLEDLKIADCDDDDDEANDLLSETMQALDDLLIFFVSRMREKSMGMND